MAPIIYSNNNSESSQSLKEHLKLVFSNSLEVNNLSKINLTIRCSYSYPIAHGLENITIPIFLSPNIKIDFSSKNFDGLIENINSKIKEWFKSNSILSRNGFVEIEIIYYTSLLKVINSPSKLRMPIQLISDLP